MRLLSSIMTTSRLAETVDIIIVDRRETVIVFIVIITIVPRLAEAVVVKIRQNC